MFTVEDDKLLGYVGGAALLLLYFLVQYIQASRKHVNVPAVGPTGPLSYWGAIKMLMRADKVMQGAYTQFAPKIFKIPEFFRWHVIVSSVEQIEELKRVPETTLSFETATIEGLAGHWTLGQQVCENSYHVGVVRGALTRNIGSYLDAMRDELARAIDDVIPCQGDGWTKAPALESILQIVTRTTNRVFVGLPVCRDPDFIDLNIRFTQYVIQTAVTLNLFPGFLRPVVGRLMTLVPRARRRMYKHLSSIIDERRQKYEEYGLDYPEKPNDMLTWLYEAAEGIEKTTESICLRMLTVNFAAIHTTSMSLTHALFHLAANPQFFAPLREEVESVVKSEGFTKISITKFYKVDSFLKESARMSSIGLILMSRKALENFTFSDGTFIPKGTTLSVLADSLHKDPKYYPEPEKFDGFRFVDASRNPNASMVSTTATYLPFGHGIHACPGRFFVANELKVLVAHILLNYDIKVEDGKRPPDLFLGTSRMPNLSAQIMFRKRSTTQ